MADSPGSLRCLLNISPNMRVRLVVDNALSPVESVTERRKSLLAEGGGRSKNRWSSYPGQGQQPQQQRSRSSARRAQSLPCRWDVSPSTKAPSPKLKLSNFPSRLPLRTSSPKEKGRKNFRNIDVSPEQRIIPRRRIRSAPQSKLVMLPMFSSTGVDVTPSVPRPTSDLFLQQDPLRKDDPLGPALDTIESSRDKSLLRVTSPRKPSLTEHFRRNNAQPSSASSPPRSPRLSNIDLLTQALEEVALDRPCDF